MLKTVLKFSHSTVHSALRLQCLKLAEFDMKIFLNRFETHSFFISLCLLLVFSLKSLSCMYAAHIPSLKITGFF